ncbi:MAG: lipoprotein signal peptidase [Bacteroidota bacterium]
MFKTYQLKRALAIIIGILALDQVLKIWVKTHMYLGQEFEMTPWFFIHFTENNGMAFGMEFGGSYGKLFLSLFRIVFVGGMIWYLRKSVREHAGVLFITVLSLIIAGAIGNIIDSILYGVLFSSSEYGLVAELFPAGGGYATLLHGKVVDMMYFPLFDGFFPEWFPFWGGEYFQFFRPVFNLADASISCGVFLWVLFQHKMMPPENAGADQEQVSDNATNTQA